MSDYQRELPEEILVNILHRLPVKTLMACACVCKPWRAMLRSPSFLQAHLSNAVGVKVDTPCYPSSPMLLLRLCPKSKEGYTLVHVPAGTAATPTSSSGNCSTIATNIQSAIIRSIPPPPLTPIRSNRYLRVVSSSAGAVLLADDSLNFTSTYALWNPTTRRLVRLPEPLVRREIHGNYEASAGLAYDYTAGDFKVLRIIHFLSNSDASGRPHPKPNRAEVFSLKSRTWRDVTAGAPTRYRATHHAPQALANGCLHYVGISQVGRIFVNAVLAFHIWGEDFRKISLPSALANDESRSNAVFDYDGPAAVARSDGGSGGGGSAATIGVLHRHSVIPMGWDVWVLADHRVSSSWTVLGRIFDGDIGVAPPKPIATNDIFAMMNNPIPFPLTFFQGVLLFELPNDHIVAVDLDAYMEATRGIHGDGKRKKKAAPTVHDLRIRGKAIYFDLVEGVMTPVRTSCVVPHVETLALADAEGDAVVVGVGEVNDHGGDDEDRSSVMEQLQVLMKRHGKDAFTVVADD